MPSCKPQTQKSKDGELIVRWARTWVGTPYHHQAQVKTVGVDCVGVVLGTGKDSGFMGEETDKQFALFDGYSRVPNPRKMRRGMELFLERLPIPASAEPPVGSIAWMQWRDDLPMHLGIMARFEGRPTMIHAYSLADKCVEATFDHAWAGRVESFWKYRGSVV